MLGPAFLRVLPPSTPPSVSVWRSRRCSGEGPPRDFQAPPRFPLLALPSPQKPRDALTPPEAAPGRPGRSPARPVPAAAGTARWPGGGRARRWQGKATAGRVRRPWARVEAARPTPAGLPGQAEGPAGLLNPSASGQAARAGPALGEGGGCRPPGRALPWRRGAAGRRNAVDAARAASL